MSLAQDNYGHSIGRAKTGDARLYDLSLTGWSNALLSKTQGGVIFWTLTSADHLRFFGSDAKGASDELCSGDVSSGLCTLAADNTSGISGSCAVAHTSGTESTGRIIVSYAEESDMTQVMYDWAGYCTANNWVGGGTRLERAFLKAKRELDSWVRNSAVSVYRNSAMQPDLADLANPRQLAEAHAFLTAYNMERLKGSVDLEARDIADNHYRDAERAFRQVALEWDFDDNNTVDYESSGSGIKLVRGRN